MVPRSDKCTLRGAHPHLIKMTYITSGLTSREFRFEGREIRTSFNDQGDAFFVAKDICDALDLDHLKVLERIPEWGQGVPLKGGPLDGHQMLKSLTEAGVYWIVLRSKKPEAEPFQRWVCQEVLPALRREGLYSLAGPGDRMKINRLRLRLEAAELRARAKALDKIAARPDFPVAPPEAVTIGEWLGRYHVAGYERLRLASRMAQVLRSDRPAGVRRGPDGRWVKAWSRIALEMVWMGLFRQGELQPAEKAPAEPSTLRPS